MAASLACPICLYGESVEWSPTLDEYEPSVHCRCSNCDECWQVYLTFDQALRLELMDATSR